MFNKSNYTPNRKAGFSNRSHNDRSHANGGRFQDQRYRERSAEEPQLLYGIHSVREALSNPKRKFIRLMVTENALMRLSEDGPMPPDLTPEIVRPSEIARFLTADAVHQGVLLEAHPLKSPTLESLNGDEVLLALDQITDPHNVGAILRSACAFGVSGVITTLRHAPEVTGVLAKAASGALEHVPIITVVNLGRALTSLGEKGYLRVGLDSEAPEAMGDIPVQRPLVLVLGAEGKGLRQSTRALCDHLGRLELPGAITSLNVSNAAAVSLYAVGAKLARQ